MLTALRVRDFLKELFEKLGGLCLTGVRRHCIECHMVAEGGHSPRCVYIFVILRLFGTPKVVFRDEASSFVLRSGYNISALFDIFIFGHSMINGCT